LTFDQMHRVQRTRAAVGGDIDAAVRRLASGPLEQLTRRIVPTRTWDDIVLSPERKQMLHGVVDRYRHATQVYDEWGFSPNPSRGLVALFSGPSGTGKTLSAEIIAGALGLDVFKLDLSSVVSKYIGETEKNLEQIFDAASAGNMVLFFDEADSLFGKRSEVSDARDRYANIEVSYLLQRLESYDGLVVMATNFEKNIDEAFVRRIHVRIEFAMPGVAERRRIWAQNLPPTAPVQDVDLDWLATRFELSGGSIRNASVHAAFLAAAEGTPITMEHAVRGVAREWRKIGRLIKPNEFGEYHDRLGLVPGGEPV
jgi:SpoVK/Ycf46/Vps4 family AAA+-type ATPase